MCRPRIPESRSQMQYWYQARFELAQKSKIRRDLFLPSLVVFSVSRRSAHQTGNDTATPGVVAMLSSQSVLLISSFESEVLSCGSEHNHATKEGGDKVDSLPVTQRSTSTGKRLAAMASQERKVERAGRSTLTVLDEFESLRLDGCDVVAICGQGDVSEKDVCSESAFAKTCARVSASARPANINRE